VAVTSVVGAESTSARAWTSSVIWFESLDSSVNWADTVLRLCDKKPLVKLAVIADIQNSASNLFNKLNICQIAIVLQRYTNC